MGHLLILGRSKQGVSPLAKGGRGVQSSVLETFGMKFLIDIQIEKSNKQLTMVYGRINELGFKKKSTKEI